MYENPGFEQDSNPSDDKPDYWSEKLFNGLDGGYITYEEDNGKARSGNDCIRVDAPRYGDYAYVYQNHTANEGQQYTIGAYFKDDTSIDISIPTAAFVHIELEFWDAESGGSPIRMPMPFITAQIPDDGQWHWVEFVETAPPGTMMISAIMGAEHSGGGAYLIDDTYFGLTGPANAYSPNPSHHDIRKITSDILFWKNQTSNPCDIYWNAGSSDVNDVNFETGKIALKTNWGSNELDLSSDCNVLLDPYKDYYWRVDCGDTGVVWKFSTKDGYLRGDVDKNYMINTNDFLQMADNWFQNKELNYMWKELEEMPIPQYGCAATIIEGKLHIFGGTRGPDNMSDAHQVYDPVDDSWYALSPMPYEYGGGRGWIGLVQHTDGYIYAFGGTQFSYWDATDDALKYDPSTDTWTRLSDMPVTKGVHAAISVGDYIYITGGNNRKTYRYDPSSDNYLKRADIPSGVSYIARARYYKDGKDYIYIVAGDDTINRDEDGYARGAYKYDIEADSWSFVDEDRVEGRTWLLTQHSTHVVMDGHKLLIAGGKKAGSEFDGHARSDLVEYFDMETETFHEVPDRMFKGRCCGSAGLIDGKLYIAGGYETWAWASGGSDDPAVVVEEIWSYPYCIDPLTGDVNEDCYVNLSDLEILVSDWLKCNDPVEVNCN
jgi:N-acetylneuraminic acid mutarotase